MIAIAVLALLAVQGLEIWAPVSVKTDVPEFHLLCGQPDWGKKASDGLYWATLPSGNDGKGLALTRSFNGKQNVIFSGGTVSAVFLSSDQLSYKFVYRGLSEKTPSQLEIVIRPRSDDPDIFTTSLTLSAGGKVLEEPCRRFSGPPPVLN